MEVKMSLEVISGFCLKCSKRRGFELNRCGFGFGRVCRCKSYSHQIPEVNLKIERKEREEKNDISG